MYPSEPVVEPPPIAESLGFTVAAGAAPGAIGLFGRSYGEFSHQRGLLLMARDPGAGVVLRRLVVEQAWVAVRSNPVDGDLVELGAPILAPYLRLPDGPQRAWVRLEPLLPSLLVADEDGARKVSLAFSIGAGLGGEVQAALGRVDLRAGGELAGRYRVGTSARSNTLEGAAEAWTDLVFPSGGFVGLRGEGHLRFEPKATDPTPLDANLGVEVGFTPRAGWRRRLYTAKNELSFPIADATPCAGARVEFDATANRKTVTLALADGTGMAEDRINGEGTWVWEGPYPRTSGDRTPRVRATLGERTLSDDLEPMLWEDTVLEAHLAPKPYRLGETLRVEVAARGACATTPGQAVQLTFSDGAVVQVPLVDGVGQAEHAVVPGVVHVDWTVNGVRLPSQPRLPVSPWPICADADGDGVDTCHGDCDDARADVRPGVPDAPGDGVDADCDGRNGNDADFDGFEVGFGDCDDGDAWVHPGGVERANRRDDDCDGRRDRARPPSPAAATPLARETDLGTWGRSSFRRTLRVGDGTVLRTAVPKGAIVRVEAGSHDSAVTWRTSIQRATAPVTFETLDLAKSGRHFWGAAVPPEGVSWVLVPGIDGSFQALSETGAPTFEGEGSDGGGGRRGGFGGFGGLFRAASGLALAAAPIAGAAALGVGFAQGPMAGLSVLEKYAGFTADTLRLAHPATPGAATATPGAATTVVGPAGGPTPELSEMEVIWVFVSAGSSAPPDVALDVTISAWVPARDR